MTDHQYGPKGHIVEAFINHLRSMSADDWDKFYAAWKAAGGAAGYAAGEASWEATGEAEWDAAREAAWEAAREAEWEAAREAEWDVAGYVAQYAAGEIQGADLMRERGHPFFFLPMFGFADERAVIAALQPKEGNP